LSFFAIYTVVATMVSDSYIYCSAATIT